MSSSPVCHVLQYNVSVCDIEHNLVCFPFRAKYYNVQRVTARLFSTMWYWSRRGVHFGGGETHTHFVIFSKNIGVSIFHLQYIFHLQLVFFTLYIYISVFSIKTKNRQKLNSTWEKMIRSIYGLPKISARKKKTLTNHKVMKYYKGKM